MCFKKPKPDPKIVEEQEKQKAEVAAKKQEEMDVAATARKQQVEETKQTKKTEAQIGATQADQQARQQELAKPVATPKPKAKAPSLVPTIKATEVTSTPEPETIIEPAKQQNVQGSELTSTGLRAKSPSDAMLRRRSRRSGRGRRSLLTSSAGGVGYFSRFL